MMLCVAGEALSETLLWALKIFWRFLAQLVFAASVFCAPPAFAQSEAVAVDAQKPVKFGVLAFRPKPEVLARWQPLIDYLNGAQLGRRFELLALDYQELDAAVRAKQIDLVLMQPALYIQLTFSEGLLSPLATLVEKEADAKAIIAQLKKGGKFEEIAKKSSKDPGSGAKGGDLDWAPAGNYVAEFATALTALTKGKLTETPVKSQFGYHIIRLDDVRDAQLPKLEEVKPQVAQQLQQQKLTQYQDDLRKKAKVE